MKAEAAISRSPKSPPKIEIGGDQPQLFIPELIEYWRQGRFPLERTIKRYAFGRIADGSGRAGMRQSSRFLLFEK